VASKKSVEEAQEEQTYRFADAEPPAPVRSAPNTRKEKAPSTRKKEEKEEPEGIKFVCSFCDETYQVSEELAGKAIRCRNCGELDRV
jgi:hypothetical protein